MANPDDDEVLANNAIEFITRVDDVDGFLPTYTQESQNANDTTELPIDPTGKYPSTEEYCHPNVTFLVLLPSTEGSGFVFSEKLQKLFLKLDSVCSFEAKCDVPGGHTFYLRAMLVSVVPESQHEPVLRCRNHQATDEGKEFECIKEHVVRCKNEQHEYVGRGTGAFFEDRYAVRVPLGADTVGTKLTLQFTCQNTCFNTGLRKTALVFTLEDEAGHVWGRQIKHIKICTNYRRDMLNEEKAKLVGKVPAVSATRTAPHAGRPRKRRTHDDTAGGPSSGRRPARSQNLSIEQHEVRLVMPSLRMAKRVLDNAIGMISAAVLRVEDEHAKSELMHYVDNIRKERQNLTISNSQCSADSELL
ncbi:AGAP004319-PA-like protein [Anopheles sinensis]|uniref:AGAP004319-PA-like protein n=1 Tax=Anopheles sinensis TaxID=74873 RepID=A0A084W6V9_ANOSI|nr:AGAP004319-PA-like protein [Anopheles sinensis]